MNERSSTARALELRQDVARICARCGERMQEVKCKVICRNCGAFDDCSDP